MLGAQLCSESLALLAAAEECLAANNPLTVELIEHVLLSPDLVPHILGLLESEDGAAAAVCSQWSAGWKATNEPRRRLKQVLLDLPEELGTTHGLQMAGTPEGRLAVREGPKVHILDRSMRVLQTVAGDYNGLVAANDDSICHSTVGSLRRFTHDGTLAAEYTLEGCGFYSPLLAPGGLLFCVLFESEGQPEHDEIVALDAQTLQLRHRFGLGLLNDANQLVVVGDELYVCDTNNHRLQVFSLTGEHRRSIMGEWRSPESLCFAKDRLYLVEREDDGDEDDDDDYGDPMQGRRLLVLSLQGDILQVVTNPTNPTAKFTSICCFDRKLLASYRYREAFGSPWKYGMLALQGL